MTKWPRRLWITRSIALTVMLICLSNLAAGCLEKPDFYYPVRVQAKDTKEYVEHAKVTIEVGGKTPHGRTDTNGCVNIRIPSSHAGQRGRLIAEAEGYERYTEEIDLIEGTPRDTILLERKEEAVVVLPSPTDKVTRATSTATPDPTPTSTPKPTLVTLLEKIWVPIVVALIGAAASIIVVILSGGKKPTKPSTDADFSYLVRVQVRDTGEAIPNTEVTIEVRGKAPLDDITDANGLARILIDSSYAEQPGILIVRATGYRTRRQHIDLTKDALPDVVMLDPAP